VLVLLALAVGVIVTPIVRARNLERKAKAARKEPASA
jgi:hypothetical protein